MNPMTRARLRKGWGFCERHAWGYLSVEASFRHGYLHGPAVLYDDLMSRAVLAFRTKARRPGVKYRPMRNLRNKGPCLMCEEGYGPGTPGRAKEDLVERGRDLKFLRDYATRTQQYWREHVCGRCLGESDVEARCRRHLLEDASSKGDVSLRFQGDLVRQIHTHISRFHRSFRYEFHGTETDEDRASLISAVGWCSGWSTLFSILEEGDGRRFLLSGPI